MDQPAQFDLRPLARKSMKRDRRSIVLLYPALAASLAVFTVWAWGWATLLSSRGLPGLLFLGFAIGLLAFLGWTQTRPEPVELVVTGDSGVFRYDDGMVVDFRWEPSASRTDLMFGSELRQRPPIAALQTFRFGSLAMPREAATLIVRLAAAADSRNVMDLRGIEGPFGEGKVLIRLRMSRSRGVSSGLG